MRRALTALAVLVVLAAGGVAYAAFAATASNSGNSYSAASSFKACDYPGTVLGTGGVVNYWRLGETSGTTAADSKGTSNGTYVNGVTLGSTGAIAGDGDKAATFDGVNDSVNVTDTAALRLNGSWSLEFWAKAVSYPGSGWPGLVKKGDATTANGYIVWFDRTSHLLRYKRNNVDYQFNSTSITTAEFRHYVITYDGTTLRAYTDGAQTNTSTVTFGTNSGTAAFQLGTADNYGNTVIDDAAVYNTALSATTVQDHYRCGQRYRDAILDTSGLVAYWRLSEPFGAVAFDSKGSNDGTYRNGVSLGGTGALTAPGDDAATFDGVDDDVNLADATTTVDFTIEGWTYLTDNTTNNNTLYGTSSKVRALARPSGYYFGVWLGGTEYALQGTLATDANINTWVHWALVRSGANLTLYRNASQIATRADLPAATSATIGGQIGRQNGSYPLEGKADEVAIFNRALTAQEIQNHYGAR